MYHLHLIIQPEPHVDQPVRGGVGVGRRAERLEALAVALGLPGADGAVPLEAGDDGLRVELAEVLGFEAAGELWLKMGDAA